MMMGRMFDVTFMTFYDDIRERYEVEVPEYPMCGSHGSTEADAIAKTEAKLRSALFGE